MKLLKKGLFVLLSLFAVFCLIPGAIAGDLEPPGAPTEGTMHTLEEIYTIVADTNSKVSGSGTGETYGAAVEKSGQTTSYVTGDDGDLQRGVALPSPRFADNGDGTVTDLLTGLMWTKDADIANGERTWAEAVSDCEACGAGDYTDWHLPQVRELHSLIHFGYYSPALSNTAGTGKWTEGDPFTDVKFSYWSSTRYADLTDYEWYVSLNNGRVYFSSKSDTYYVWCVRGGPD